MNQLSEDDKEKLDCELVAIGSFLLDCGINSDGNYGILTQIVLLRKSYLYRQGLIDRDRVRILNLGKL